MARSASIRWPFRPRGPVVAGRRCSGSRSPRRRRLRGLRLPVSVSEDAERARDAHGRAAAERTTVAETTAERDELKAQLAQVHRRREGQGGGRREAQGATSTRSSRRCGPASSRSARRWPCGKPTTAPTGARRELPGRQDHRRNGIDVSERRRRRAQDPRRQPQEVAAKARIVARASSAPPPKELKSLFHRRASCTPCAPRALLSALEDAGLRPRGRRSRARPTSRRRARRGKKAAPVVDRAGRPSRASVTR